MHSLDISSAERVNREVTLSNYLHAIERVTELMRHCLRDALTIDELAESACMSRYHFIRVFSQVTGVSPARFLAALRMQEAKKILLQSNQCVTDITFDTGYNSLGTFTRIFTDFVGLPPTRFRQLGNSIKGVKFSDMKTLLPRPKLNGESPTVTGEVTYKSSMDVVVVAKFSTPIPRSLPQECVCLTDSRNFSFHSQTSLETRIFAVGLPRATTIEDALLLDDKSIYLGSMCPTVSGEEGSQINLRERVLVDPPIVVAFPLLIAESILMNRRASAIV